MKKLFLMILLFSVCMNLISCQNTGSDPCDLPSGTYYMVGDFREGLTPYITLNFEDHSFRFCEGVLISYAEYGDFIVKGNRIKSTSQSTVFVFEITDNHSLILVDNGDNESFQMPENAEFVFYTNDSKG